MHSYDLIAAIYDRDMGASMRLDDAGYYLELARAAEGTVLELGCGTGRILARLAGAGLPAVGIDRSLPMLRIARERCGPGVPLARMDMRRLALRGGFALALLPYSLPTYLLGTADWSACARGLRAAMRPGGRVLLDAFIPREDLAEGRWIQDYARPQHSHFLVRHKRINRFGDGTRLIERRYRLRGEFGGRTLVTRERIRPLTPSALVELGERHFGPLVRIDYDYRSDRVAEDAAFCSALFELQKAE